MLSTRHLSMAPVLAMLLAAGACRTAGVNQDQVIRELETRILVGTPRDEIEDTLQEMQLDYLYVPRSLLEAMRQAEFDSTPLSGRLQVTLPAEKGVLFQLVGEALIELDGEERMVGMRIQRGRVPR